MKTEAELEAHLLTAINSAGKKKKFNEEIKAYVDACQKRSNDEINAVLGQGRHQIVTNRITRTNSDFIKSQNNPPLSTFGYAALAEWKAYETWKYCKDLHTETEAALKEKANKEIRAKDWPDIKPSAFMALLAAKKEAAAVV